MIKVTLMLTMLFCCQMMDMLARAKARLHFMGPIDYELNALTYAARNGCVGAVR